MTGLVVDLFAGPGGWSEGARQLGIRDVGLEWDDAACRTRKAAGHLTVRADVAAYPVEPFVGKTWGLIASPPCQDFSLAGKRAGINGDRGQLVWQVLRWADALRPEWIACEQVPPVLPVWRHMAHVLRGWGYQAWAGVLNAADYGVPQTRQRAFLIASRVGPAQPPDPTHAKDATGDDLFGGSRLPWVTMAKALGWGMSERPCVTVTAGSGRQGGPDPLDGGSGARETLRRERREGRWVTTSENGRQQSPGFDPDDRPARTVTGHDLGKHGWFVSAGVTGEGRPKDPATTPADTLTGKGTAYWIHERPATTVVGSFSPDVISPPGYRTHVSRQNAEGGVRVTVAEGGVLQSFPPDYPWQGSRSKQYEQVGNAVPPLLAAHVLSSVTGIALRDREAVA